jgi:hypothetical protein
LKKDTFEEGKIQLDEVNLHKDSVKKMMTKFIDDHEGKRNEIIKTLSVRLLKKHRELYK